MNISINISLGDAGVIGGVDDEYWYASSILDLDLGIWLLIWGMD